MRGSGTLDDLGQKPAAMTEPERLDHRVVVAAGAEVAEREAGLRRIGGPNIGQVQVEPVLAMQCHFGAVQQSRDRAVHLGHLRALLTGVEPGAGRLEASALEWAGREPGHTRRGAGVEPQPGITHRLVPGSHQPGAVALRGDGDRDGAARQTLDPVAESPQCLDTVGPGLAQRLARRTIRTRLVSVEHRSRGELASGEIEGYRLDDGRPRIDADQNVGTIKHRAFLHTRRCVGVSRGDPPCPSPHTLVSRTRESRLCDPAGRARTTDRRSRL